MLVRHVGVFVVFSVWATTRLACGATIDGFTDPVLVTNGDEQLSDVVPTEQVGDFDATRVVRVYNRNAVAITTVTADIAGTEDGSLLASLDSSNVDLIGQPSLGSVDLGYAFSGADFTGGGANNAIFVEFGASSGLDVERYESEFPVSPRLRIRGDDVSRFSISADTIPSGFVPNLTESFVAVVPFDSFTSRCCVTSEDRNNILQEVTALELNLVVIGDRDASFATQTINRIWVGSTPIPEPTTCMLLVFAIASMTAGCPTRL